MNAPAINRVSPSGDPDVLARRTRIAELCEMAFNLGYEQDRDVFSKVHPSDKILLEGLWACGHFINAIGLRPSDRYDIAEIDIKGIDRENYVMGFDLSGPGFVLHTAHVDVTRLFLSDPGPAHEGATSDSLEFHSMLTNRVKM